MFRVRKVYGMAEISVREAARRLGISERRTREMLRGRELVGRQIDGHIWQIDAASVQDRARVDAGNGRPWADHTVEAIVEALSDRTKIDPKSAQRLRRTETNQLWRKIAQAFTVHRFNARNLDTLRPHMALTGESAMEQIGERLVGQARSLHGYLHGMSLEEFIDESGLVVAGDGNLAIYLLRSGGVRDGAAPWIGDEYARRALIAVDCARSATARVRSTGVRALDDMRNMWLATST
jgi:hypothetical protein